jgi:hypothetical protein
MRIPEYARLAEAALKRQWLGDMSDAEGVRAQLTVAGDELAKAWGLALDVSRWLATPGRNSPELLDRAQAFVDAPPEVRRAALFALADFALLHFICADAESLRQVERLGQRLALGQSGDAEVIAATITLYRKALLGEAMDAEADADRISERAGAIGLAPMLMAAQSLRAYALLGGGDVPAARAVARRASRMARTEALPQYEYLANLVLARTRRLSGNPHLATRILTALARYAPTSWRPALIWELTLSGSDSSALTQLEALPPWMNNVPATRAAKRLAAVLNAAEQLSVAEFDRAAEALREAVVATPQWARDAEIVLAALDARAPTKVRKGADVQDWLLGKTSDAPAALSGLIVRYGPAAADSHSGGYVVAGPGRAPRRILGRGVHLAMNALDAALVRSPDRAQERREMATAVLALSGDVGLAEDTFFELVYGLTYDKAVHRNMFDALLHRVREALGETGHVTREGGTLRLVPKRTLVLADPRCAESLSDRVLRVIAEHAEAGAKDIADTLGVPLRTIQACLRELSDEGAFEVDVEGKKRNYRIVDTTFSEPTQH